MNKLQELQIKGDRMYQELWWTYYVKTGKIVPEQYFMKGKFLLERQEDGFTEPQQFTGYVPPDEWLHLPELGWLIEEILRISNEISIEYHKAITNGFLSIYATSGKKL